MIDLKSFPLFSTLPTREVEKLKKSSRVQRYTSGTKILNEGEDLREFLFITEGELAVVKTHKEKKKTLLTLNPGDTYGEVEILNGTPVLANLVGYQETQLIFLPKEAILRLVGLYPGFAKELRDLYSQRASVLLEQGLSKAPFGEVLTFFNVKGGAGKSVISANVGAMLARKWRKRVVLIDANFSFGDQAILLNLPQEKNIFELTKERPPIKIEKIEAQLTTHRSGLKVLLPPPMPEQAEKIKIEMVEHLIEALRAHYDFVIIDTQNQLTDLERMILEFSDLIFLVMTMELTFVKNTKVLIDLLQRSKIPRDKIKVILNRAFKSMGLEPARVETSLRYAISHFLPSEGEVVIPSINKGVPFVLEKIEGSPLIFAMEKFCQRLVGEEPDKGTWNMFSLIMEVFGL